MGMDEGNQANPYIPPNPFGVKQEYWERIQNMRLMDDAFMRAALKDNIEAAQLILRIILGNPDLKVVRIKTQVEVKNLYGRSIWMDADVMDSKGNLFDVEMERDKYRASPKRLRYHSAMRDTSSLKEGEDFEKLPTSYIIFVTEEDRWGKGLPLYHVDRKIEETGEDFFGDCCHFIYVNGAYKGDDPIGLLMADLRERDPNKMHYPELAKRVAALKNSEEEVKKMCQAMEITYQEGQRDGLLKGYARSVKSLMRRRGVSSLEAMDDLEIPEEDRQACAEYMVRQDESETA